MEYVSKFLCTAFAFTVALAAANIAQAGNWKLKSSLTCEDRNGVIDRLAEDTKVTVNADAVEVGKKFNIKWSRGRFPEREPVFLMISFKEPVRFSGDALYGLLPGAKAAFNISWDSQRTRAVIPYYGRGVPKSGTLSVEPILSGGVSIKWAVVGYNGCTEHLTTPNQGSKDVAIETSGRPRIVINDPDDLGTPTAKFINKTGDRILEVFEGRFRLVDVASGAEVLETIGSDPYFSPTGRYLVVPGGDRSGVYDVIDGKALKDGGSGIWSHNDSFTLDIAHGYGSATIGNSITEQTIGSTANGCRICSGVEGKFSIDLENNSVLAEIYNEFNVTKVSGGADIAIFRPDILTGQKVTNAARAAVIKKAMTAQGLIKYRMPVNLKFSDNMEIPEHEVNELWISNSAEELARMPKEFTPYVQKAIPLSIEQDTAARTAAISSSALQWRALKVTPSQPKNTEALLGFTKRLSEFGIEVKQPIPSKHIERYQDFPVFDINQPFDQYQKALQEKNSKIWEKISASTGFPRSRFELEFQCAAGSDKVVGNFTRAWHWQHNGNTYWLTNYECAAGSALFHNPTTLFFSDKFPGGILSYTPSWGGLEYGFDLDNPDNTTGPECGSQLDNCELDIKVFGNLLLLYSTAARGYAIVDTNSGKLLTKQFGLPRGDLFNDILLTSDGKHAVSVQDDGSFFVNRLSDTKTILSGRYIDDEVVVWTEDGRFDATSEGAHFVSYKFPGHFGEYTAHQFEGFLKVPGLISQVMSGNYTTSTLEITPPPILRADIGIEQSQLRITAEAKAHVPVKSLNLYQDGLLTDVFSSKSTALFNQWQETVTVLPGTKWISLVAIDNNNVASAPYGIAINQQIGQRNLHIFAAGVNVYDHSDNDRIVNLEAAVADANLFVDALSALPSDRATIVSNTSLLDHEASPARVLSVLENIAGKANAGDTIAFFFAGHGVQGNDGNLYLATSKTNENDIEGTALPFERIAEILKQSKARIVMFLDTCHSGLAGQGLFSTNDDVAGNVLEKVPSGIVVFSAAKGREFALEDRKVGNGFFTKAIADVVGEERQIHDTNKNGTIELSELFRGVKQLVVKRVSELQRDIEPEDLLTQTPWMARNRMVGDFALF